MGIYKRKDSKWWWGTHNYKRFRLQVPVGSGSDRAIQRQKAKEIFNQIVTEKTLGVYEQRQLEREKTLGDMLARWMDDHGGKLASAPNLRIYQATLLRHLGADTKLVEVTSDKIEAYKALRGKDVGPSAINNELRALRAAFNFAIKKWDWYSRLNPVSKVGLLSEGAGRDRWLSNKQAGDEYDRLKEAAPAWFWDICSFAIATGLRRSELVRMTWADVDLERRSLVIPQSKNGKPAAIPLLDAAVAILRRKRAECVEADQVRSTITRAVFYDPKTHRPYTRDRLTREMGKSCKRAGIDNFRLHDLRHTAATYLARQGVDSSTRQRFLRHATSDMTERYTHHDTDSVRANIEARTKIITAVSRSAS